MAKYVLGALLLASFSCAASADETVGSWNFKVITDPMSDAVRGIASTSMSENITIVVKCDSNGPGSIYVSLIASNYLGGVRNNYREVKYRFDGSTPAGITAYHDGRTASILELSPDTKGGAFLRGLAQSKETVLQVYSYDYDSYTAVVPTTGAATAIQKVATACRDTEWAQLGS